jgi:hypothetical protein
VSDRLLYNHGVPQFHTDGTELYEPCPSCHGVGWLPSPAVLEAMAEAMVIADSSDLPSAGHPWWNIRAADRNEARRVARAAWEAQARILKERMG